MNVNYIVPIKKYLAKYLRSKDGKIHYEGYIAVKNSFDYYNGYKIKRKELLDLYVNKKLFRHINPNQYPNEYLLKYSLDNYYYLRFNFPVTNKKPEEIFNNKGKFKGGHAYIKNINMNLDFYFWHDIVYNVYYRRESTVENSIDNFYSFYNLLDTDYKKRSLKTMIYKLKKNTAHYPIPNY